MNVSQSPKALVGIKFNENHWNFFFALIIVFENSEHCFLHVIHDNVEVDLIFFVALCVECMSQLNHIWMLKFFHYL